MTAPDGSPLSVALGYIRRKWSPTPVGYRAKIPTLRDWPHVRIGEAEAARHFNGQRQNIGVLLGSASGNLVDADLDSPEALALADHFLPPSGSMFGRPGKQRAHRLYVSDLPRLVKFVDPDDGEMLLELRTDGCQTVFPGSTHESGEPVEWDEGEGDDPPWVDPTALRTAGGRLAAACFLVRAAPAEDRHSYLVDVSGALVRELGKDGAAHILDPAARGVLGKLYNRRDGQRLIEDTARKLAAGEPVSGWPKLVERLGAKRAGRLSEWLGLPSVEHGAEQAENIKESAEAKTAGDALLDTSHDGLALEMGREWADARHVAAWGQWLFYDGSRWERDERLHHMTRTREFLRRKADELVRWANAKNDEKLVGACEAAAKQLRAAQTVANVVNLARSNPDQVATSGQWDADPFELGVPKSHRSKP